MFKNCSDEDLIGKIAAGEADCIEELLHRYSTKVYSLAMRLVGSREDAEEVHQDVFVAVYKKASAFLGNSAFSSWIYRITVNSALMKLRSRRGANTISMEDLPSESAEQVLLGVEGGADAEEELDNTRLSRALESAIWKLPDEYRPVYVLRDINGISSTQVGKMLALSIPTVKSRLHRSRLILRRRLMPLYREHRSFRGEQAGV